MTRKTITIDYEEYLDIVEKSKKFSKLLTEVLDDKDSGIVYTISKKNMGDFHTYFITHKEFLEKYKIAFE